MDSVIIKIHGLVIIVLEFVSRFGKILNRFAPGGTLDDLLNKPAEELLHTQSSMAVVLIFFSLLPVMFILNAVIRNIKRKRIGVFMKNRCRVDGIVSEIVWKKFDDGSYDELTKDRYAKVSYKVKYKEYILRCPAGGILKGDKVCVVCEKTKPTQAMLERDYEDAMKGRISEIILGVIGAFIIIVMYTAVFIALSV